MEGVVAGASVGFILGVIFTLILITAATRR
jgi:hypothetical protein